MFPLHASKSTSDSALIFVSTVKCNLLKRERRVHYIYPHFYSSCSFFVPDVPGFLLLSLLWWTSFGHHFREICWEQILSVFLQVKKMSWFHLLSYRIFSLGENFGVTVLSLSTQTLRLGSLPPATMCLRRNLLYVKRLSPGCSTSFLSRGPEESSFVYFSEAWSSGLQVHEC